MLGLPPFSLSFAALIVSLTLEALLVCSFTGGGGDGLCSACRTNFSKNRCIHHEEHGGGRNCVYDAVVYSSLVGSNGWMMFVSVMNEVGISFLSEQKNMFKAAHWDMPMSCCIFLAYNPKEAKTHRTVCALARSPGSPGLVQPASAAGPAARGYACSSCCLLLLHCHHSPDCTAAAAASQNFQTIEQFELIINS